MENELDVNNFEFLFLNRMMKIVPAISMDFQSDFVMISQKPSQT